MKISGYDLPADSKETCRYHKKRRADLCIEIGSEKLYVCLDCQGRTDRMIKMMGEWEKP